MKLREIQNQLREYLPRFTNRFNDWDSATYTVAGNIATVVTSEPHGMPVGALVNIQGVVMQNPIASLVSTDGTARAETQVQHDLTQGFQDSIEIDGANETQFNGEFTDKIRILNRNIFEYPTEANDNTTATGSPVLLEKDLIRYNGLFKVSNVVDTTTFEIEINGEFDFSTTCRASVKVPRIAVAYSAGHALSLFAEKDADKWWLFIVPQGDEVNKNRNGDIDFNMNNNNDDYDQFTEESFTLNVIAKANNEVTPLAIMDECAVEIRNAIFKAIVNWQCLQTNSSKYSKVAYGGSGGDVYDNGKYLHEYNISCILRLRNEDVHVADSAATRKFIVDYRDNDTINQLTIALDQNEFKEN